MANPSRWFGKPAGGLSCEKWTRREIIPVCAFWYADGIVEAFSLMLKLSSVRVGSDVCQDTEERDPQEGTDKGYGVADKFR